MFCFSISRVKTCSKFYVDLQDFFEDVGPLLSLQLGGSTMDELLKIFNAYVNLLISALPGSMDAEGNLEGLGNKIIRMAETEEQQLALLANASLLAEELLPRAAMKLSSVNQASVGSLHKRDPDKQIDAAELREWKRKLHHMVDKLRDSFCRLHAVALIFTEEGGTHLSAETYINMDNNVEEIEWAPSLVFQVLTCFSLKSLMDKPYVQYLFEKCGPLWQVSLCRLFYVLLNVFFWRPSSTGCFS